MDTQFCSGDTSTGRQCRCRRFVVHLNAKCGCDHPEGYHPAPPTPADAPAPSAVPVATSASIIASYQTPNQILKKNTPHNPQPTPSTSHTPQSTPSTSRLPTSVSVALQETKAGMKRHITDTPAEGDSRVSKKSRKKSDKAKEVAIGGIIFLVTQSVHQNSPSWAVPRDAAVASLEKHSLAINGLRQPLAFGEDFTMQDMDNLLRARFQNLFEYMDVVHPLDPKSNPRHWHWNLLIRTNSILTLFPSLEVDATDIKRYIGTSATKPLDRKLYLVSTHPIPESVYSRKNGVWVYTKEPARNESESDTYSEEQWSDASRSWHGTDDDMNTAKLPSPNPSIMSIRSDSEVGDDFPMALTSTVPSSTTLTPSTGPQPHPSVGISPPPSPGFTARISRYSVYSTMTGRSKNFIDWGLPIDDFFWTRPANDSDI
ncbi:hypothetical protein C8R46DRAFT_1206151 [Mycena filopes]|nr:hypothetical protein C8R46DRAFT_1206151 [Mycena filopes]